MDIEKEYKTGRRNFDGLDLESYDLSGTNLMYASFRGANLAIADLHEAVLTNVDLTNAILREADLREAILYHTNLTNVDLTGAILEDAGLYGANLTGTTGWPETRAWLDEHFEEDAEGYIVYKVFDLEYHPPSRWHIAPGSIIEEHCDTDRVEDCSYGINVATTDWLAGQDIGDRPVWMCRIRHEWVEDVIVPYISSGKIRTPKLQLIKTIR